jgi:hypothetical protein
MFRIFPVFLILFITGHSLTAQDTFILKGKITSEGLGDPLIGAAVYITGSTKGVVADKDGNYTFRLKKGTYQLEVSYLGYKPVHKELSIRKDTVVNFSLTSSSIQAKEIVITAKNPEENTRSTETGTMGLSMKEIKALPALMGEKDALRALQLSPGVQTVTEGNSGIYVRGGDAGQNLVLFDKAPVYNASHVLGFFSVFNGDIVRDIKLTKSGIPAYYGGKLASVIEVNSIDGSYNRFIAQGSIGLISSRLTVEVPVISNKVSLVLAYRRSYLDEVLKPIIRPFIKGGSSFYNYSRYYFYDLNGKLNLKLTDRDRLSVSFYNGLDNYKLERLSLKYKNTMYWGNTLAAINYYHIFNRNWYLNSTASYTNYQFNFDASQNKVNINLYSAIKDYAGKLEFTKTGRTDDQVKFGLEYHFWRFQPNNIDATTNDLDLNFGSNRSLYAHEASAYYHHIFDVSDKIRVSAGLRFTDYMQVGPYQKYIRNEIGDIYDTVRYGRNKTIKSYYQLEPRFSMRFLLHEVSSLKASYTVNHQNLHLASASSVTLPTDVWLPSTDRIRPEKGIQYSLGYFRNLQNNMYQSSIEFYYKEMRNQIELLYGIINDYTDNTFEESMVFGKGTSYGAELLLRKLRGKLTGWIGYTLSRTDRQFHEINEGKIYPAKYDRRHDVNVVATYELSKKWTFSGTFVFATGNAMTLPEYKYIIEGNVITGYGPTNAFRMPAYHRLDLSATYTAKKTDKYESSWNFSVFNVYNRANPFYIYFEITGNVYNYNLEITPRQISLFPILPSVSWSFKF